LWNWNAFIIKRWGNRQWDEMFIAEFMNFKYNCQNIRYCILIGW